MRAARWVALGTWVVARSCFPFIRAHGVVVSHPLCMRKALGSIPSVSIALGVVAAQGAVFASVVA